MRFLKPGLKFKILALIFGMIALSALILIFNTYLKLSRDITIKNNEVFQTFANTFYSERDILTKKYSMSLDILMENTPILEAFKNKDREKLQDLLLETYNSRLKHFYNIEQFQFHLPPAKSFYRVHAPKRFGDDLSSFRKTVVTANIEKNMIAGLEVGRAGLGLRVVKPIWYNYSFLGTVEFGGNIENLLSTPANATKVDFAVGIFTDSLKRSKFFYTDKTKGTYNNMYVYNYSSPTVKNLITQGLMSLEDELISINDKYYMVKQIPLKDFSSDQIGYLLLSRDTTQEVEDMYAELIKQILIIFSYAVIVTAILTVILIKIFFSPLEQITKHISSVKNGQDIPKEPIKIKGRSEITALAETFNILSDKLIGSFDKINKQINEIQAINTSLENRVQERTTEQEETNTKLKSAMKEIKFANEAKSEFLARMSHEIRTPMNAVLGLSYLIMQTELSSKQYDYVNKIRNSANLLLEIINDVLDFSKIEAGKLELEESPFNLKNSVRKLSEMVEIAVNKKDINIEINIDEAIPDYLIGDQLRITQVLNNLGTNAAKFTETGKIDITAKLTTKNENYARIRITVSDTGIGIPEDKIPVLFDSFTQVKRKGHRRLGGSGLGLSISKKILDAMNSDISVESREGEGSSFSFSLTLLIASDAEISENALTEQKLNGKRILVCEPDPINFNSASSFFRENLADVLSISNQYDLIKQISQNTDCQNKLVFDLIVLDSKAVTEDSFQTLNLTLKSIDKALLPPIIVISGDTNITEAASTIADIKTYLVNKSESREKISELVYELLSDNSKLQPDLECIEYNNIPNSSIKALIVDDNDINLQVITEFASLLNLGYTTAKSGEDSIEIAAGGNFDIIFMDIIMPGIDGITAAKHIRKLQNCKNTPIYALSANTMPEDIEKCRQAGMNGHIAKPVKLQDLSLALRDCCPQLANKDIHQSNSINPEILPEGDDVLNTEFALSNLNGNCRLYSELLKKYYFEYQGLDLTVDDKILTETFGGLRVFFHTIKGVAKTIGAGKLGKVAEKLEKMAAKEEAFSGDINVAEFKKEAKDLDDKLKQFIKGE